MPTLNPFVKHAAVLRDHYGAAVRIRALVLHLYNAANPVDMGYLMRGIDAHHRSIVFELLHWYAEHGENDAVFMETARALVQEEK